MSGERYVTSARAIAATEAPLIGAQRRSNPACLLLKDVYSHLHDHETIQPKPRSPKIKRQINHETTQPTPRKRGRPPKIKPQINTSHAKLGKPKPRCKQQETDLTEIFNAYDLWDTDSEADTVDSQMEIVFPPKYSNVTSNQTDSTKQPEPFQEEESDTNSHGSVETIEADQLERDIMAELLNCHISAVLKDLQDNADVGIGERMDYVHSDFDSSEEGKCFVYNEFLKECESVFLRQKEERYGVEMGWPVQRIEAVSRGIQPEFLIRYKRNNFGYIVVERVPLPVLLRHCSQQIIQDFRKITQNITMKQSGDTIDYIIL